MFSDLRRTPDFFIGDVRAGFSVIPGVVGSTSSRADFDIAQTIVYTSALTDQQVADVNEWLSSNPSGTGGGGGGKDLRFTQITVAEDSASVSLTWRSKPGKQYAIDLSYDLQEGNWEELNDEIDSEGTETSTVAPTFSGQVAPDPLPSRVYFRIREL